MKSISFIGGMSFFGIYYIYESGYLNVYLDNVNMFNTMGVAVNGIGGDDYSRNRTIVWSNSLFADNINDANSLLLYIQLYSEKFKYIVTIRNLTVINCISNANIPILGFISYGSNTVLMINNCSFINNTQNYNIFLISCIKHWSSFILNNTLIQNNVALQQFSRITQVVYNDSNNIYKNNTSLKYMIYSRSSSVTMVNTSLENTNTFNFLYFMECFNINFNNVIFSNTTTQNVGILIQKALSLNFINFTIDSFISSSSTNIFDIYYLLGDYNMISNLNIFNITTAYSIFNLHEIMSLNFVDSCLNVYLTPFCFYFYKSYNININNFSLSNVLGNNVFEDGVTLYLFESNLSLNYFSYHSTKSMSLCNNKIIILNSQFSLFNSIFYDIIVSIDQYLFYGSKSQIEVINITTHNINSIIYIEESKVLISDSNFVNSYKNLNETDISFIMLISNYILSIISTKFINLTGLSSSILIDNTAYNNTSIMIEDCIFLNNSAINSLGGSLHMKNAYISLSKNIFIANKATRGGAVYFDCLPNNKDLCLFTLSSNIFQSNIADIDGGAYKWQYIRPIDINNTYINNSAKYSNDYSGYFSRFGVQITDSEGILIFSSFSQNSSNFYYFNQINSDEFISQKIEIFPLDDVNQIISEKLGLQIYANLISNNDKINWGNDITNILEILAFISSPNCNNSYYESFIYGYLFQSQTENFTYNFQSSIKVRSCPTTLLYLQFSAYGMSQSIKSNTYGFNNSINEVFNDSGYSFVIPIKLRDCKIGEIYNHHTYSCHECPINTYSLNIMDSQCFTCPSQAICLGGDQILMNKDNWRTSFLSDQIYECQRELHNCLGGFDSLCDENYEGRLCSGCKQTDGENFFYKNITGKCQECPNIISFFFIAISFYCCFLVLLYFIMYIYNRSWLNNDQKFVIKMFIYYFHSWVLIQTYNVDLQNSDLEGYITMLNQFSNLSKFWISIDCLNKDTNPMLNNAVSLIFIYCVFFFCYGASKISFFKKFMTSKDSLIFIYYILYPSIFCLLYQSVICQNIDDSNYLYLNSNISCYDASYYRWIILFYIPNIMIYGGIIPGIIFKDIKSNEKNKKKSICFIGCKNAKRWESFIFSKNISIIFVLYSPYENSLKIIIMLFIMMISHFIEISYFKAAFMKKKYNEIYTYLKSLMLLNIYFLLWLSDGFNNKLAMAGFVVIIIMNVAFVFFLLFFHFKSVPKKVKKSSKIHCK